MPIPAADRTVDPPAFPQAPEDPARDAPPARSSWWRTVFGGACVLFFALVGVTVASTWDGLILLLTRTPAPVSPTLAAARPPAAPTEAQHAVILARQRLDAGQPAAALAALRAVRPGDPEYPFASQLRGHAERMLDARTRATGTR